MFYSKLEVSLIFKGCSSRDEVIEAAKSFTYLARVCELEVPQYVSYMAHLRFKVVK